MEGTLKLWAMLFAVALIPGGSVGYLIARLPFGIGWLTAAAACLAFLLGYILSITLPVGAITTQMHMRNIALYSLPIFTAILLGSLAKRYTRPPPRS
jgi:hypothetical protein